MTTYSWVDTYCLSGGACFHIYSIIFRLLIFYILLGHSISRMCVHLDLSNPIFTGKIESIVVVVIIVTFYIVYNIWYYKFILFSTY